jgi:DNA-binding helix-hairpin-helix protein with protein kinase domain
MNLSARSRPANSKVERFNALKSEFSKLVHQFRHTEESVERHRLIESAYTIIQEAQFLMEQNRRKLAEGQKRIIEIKHRTTGKTKRQKVKDSPRSSNCVPFRPIRSILIAGFQSLDPRRVVED